jgi:peroxiredoxin
LLLRALFATTFATALVADLAAGAPLPVVRPAPELTFHLPGGQQKELSDYRGKVVALEFILTTCSHCQAASHVLSKLSDEFGPKGFQAVDIAINTSDEATVKQFIVTQKTTFPVGWIDFGSIAGNVRAMMHYMDMLPNDRPSMPQQMLIDRAGNVRYQTPPPSDTDAVSEPLLRVRVIELLGGKTR